MKPKYRVFSLFVGIGGIDLAFEKAKFKIVYANEIDKHACKTYRLNFPNANLVEGDIQLIDAKSIPDFEILVAGFPCQAFSSVGLKKGFDDPRGNLFFETARVIKEKKPKAVFFENVANLIKHDNGNTFSIIKTTLEDLGYHVLYKIMNASDYGIPQQRNRIYIVGFLDEDNFKKFVFPEVRKLKKTAFDLFDTQRVDSSYYLNNHKKWADISQTVVDKKRIYRFTDWGISKGRENICPTLLAAMGGPYDRIPFFKDDFSIRRITQREAARLQGFSDNFILPINKFPKQVYKQIGNSVCVPLVKEIAKELYKTIKGSK